MILKRLKNLWKLSSYNPQYDVETINGTLGVEDKLTIRKDPSPQRLASIIDLNAKDPFDDTH